MNSPSQFSFAQVPSVSIPRSKFDRSFTYKTSFNSGYLVPVLLEEVLPGDTINCTITALARLATPIVPFFDNGYLSLHAFNTPDRIVWEDFDKFCGAADNYGAQTGNYTIPSFDETESYTPTPHSLADYFGLPLEPNVLRGLSCLPFRMYNLIWNEHYRDENLQPKVPQNFASTSVESIADYTLLKRGKRHDYFTSCLPWPSKGPGVSIPLGGSAPVYGSGDLLHLSGAFGGQNVRIATDPSYSDLSLLQGANPPNAYVPVATKSELGAHNIPNAGLYADLSSATAATINSLRTAFQIQRLYEKDARGGTRMGELIRSHFGCTIPDLRLQRPEYLGGAVIKLYSHAVPQTSSTDSTSPQGNLSAYSVLGGSFNFSKSFVEHGYVMVLASINADLTYQQGIPRHWSRKTRFDFYWPSLAHLGEMSVLNKEIFFSGNPTVDNAVFGYQERWAEYRYGRSMITGYLRSGITGSLDVWHLAQHFTSTPTLSSTFIEENPPFDRVIAVTDPNYPQFIYDSFVKLIHVRPMPVYSVPGLIDHL